ncbi:HAD-IIIA family hydrolase [Candidatus Dependentiae bacterium]|nr:HAD-IIIA family hydrolase [Candidatus Dependentiae bacterium]
MYKKIKAAFFDRDGTLIKDVSYLSDVKQIEVLPGIIKFCLFLQSLGYKLFVITNQSGVARGYFDEQFVEKTHQYLFDIFKKKGIVFEKFYYCPHHPIDAVIKKFLINCSCRKPKPGLLLKAAEEFNIDLKSSLMFGDRSVDIDTGNTVGCKSFYIKNFIINNFNKIEFEKMICKKGSL